MDNQFSPTKPSSNGNHLPSNGLEAPNVFYLEQVPSGGPSPQRESKTFLDYVHVILNRKLILAAFLLVGLGVAVVILLRETPTYQAITTLELRTLRTGAGLVNSSGNPDDVLSDTGSDLETQIRILESDTLAKRVREQLRWKNPDKVYEAPDIFAAVRHKLRLPFKPHTIRTMEIPPVTTKVAVLGGSKVVAIVCESWDAKVARDYSNTLAAEYQDYNLENLVESTNRISSWLSKQVQDARGQLETSEDRLQAYAREANLVYLGGDQQESDESKTLRDLQDDLAKATAERVMKEAAYEVAKNSASVESVPQVAMNSRLGELQTKLAELNRKYAELSITYTDAHESVATVLAQIKETKDTLDRERQAVMDRISNEYQQALGVERMLSTAYAGQLPKASDTARKGIQYGLMKWEVETNRRIYEELLGRVKALSIGSTLQANNSVILDRADLPHQPVRPVVYQSLLAGGGSGLLLGILVALLIEFVSRTFKAPGEVEFHLGVPELGVIPAWHSLVAHDVPPKWPAFLLPAPGDPPAGEESRVELVTFQEQGSAMAEAYRNTLTSLLFSTTPERRPRVILITSWGRGEGKSAATSNLGITLAEINQRTILIDADLRKPSLHRVFNVSNAWGLSDILREKSRLIESPLVALAKPTAIDGLYLLPAGPGAISIANLFHSERMLELINRLRLDFDTIIIDSPPMSCFSDGRILGRVTDGAVLVVNAGRTTRDEALSAMRRLKADGIAVLGTVLNRWDGTSKSRYGYGYSTYAYEQKDS